MDHPPGYRSDQYRANLGACESWSGHHDQDHRRVILIDIVEVKVSGLPFSCHIIYRIAGPGKIMNIHIVWNQQRFLG